MRMTKKKKIITIYDIAKLTGVSAATVSNAINDKGFVSGETRAKILKVVQELNYSPNPAARSLKTKKTNHIMLAMNHMRDYFYFDMIDAVHDVAEKYGYSLILNFTEDDEKKELRLLNSLNENFVDGLILVSIIFSEKHLNEMTNINCPVVFSGICNNRLKDSNILFDYVGVDTQMGTYISTKHLISQGHTKIGYVGLPLKIQEWDERYEGFCLAMKESKLEINEKFVILGGYNEQFGFEAGLSYAKLGNLPTAICAASDLIVIGIYKAFEQEGIRIPDDICIIGMDNIDIDTLVKPKISSVAIAQGDIGRTAAELIFKRLNGSTGPNESIIFQPRLIVRESSVKR